jgi:Arc/MetJ family transcription regulator
MAKKKIKEAAPAYRANRPQKKTLNLDQALLDEARAALGVRTETEAVHRALELLVRRRRQEIGFREFLKLGPLDASRIE